MTKSNSRPDYFYYYETARSIKYHAARQRFLSHVHTLTLLSIVFMSLLILADFAYKAEHGMLGNFVQQYGVFGLFLGVIFTIDLSEKYHRCARQHRRVKEKLLCLSKTWFNGNTKTYEEQYKHISSSLPEVYTALSAICYNEVCQQQHLAKYMVRITPLQRLTKHLLTWRGTKFFYRGTYGNVHPSAVAYVENLIKSQINQSRA